MRRPSAAAAHHDFVEMLDVDLLIDDVVDISGDDPIDVGRRVRTALEEARNALEVIWVELPEPGARILEVGAGLGLLSLLLASLGYDVTAAEPGGVGFEAHVPLSAAVGRSVGGTVTHLDTAGEKLDPERDGRFDLAFSMNVLEHVESVSGFLDGVLGVLCPGRPMVHSCPNYLVPYEPHFGVPLVPFRPAATARLLPTRITDSGLWKSLNFVAVTDIRRFAAERHLDVEFRSGLLADALRRCATDPLFGSRHPRLVPVAKVLARRPFVSAVDRVPVAATTPMVFTVTSPAAR